MFNMFILQVYKYSPIAIGTFALGIILFVSVLLLLFLMPKKKEDQNQVTGLSTYGLLIFVIAFLSILCLISSMFLEDTVSSPSYRVTNVTTGNYLNVNGTIISSKPFSSNNLALGLAVLFSIVDATIGIIAIFLYGFKIFEAKQKKKYEL